MEIEKGITLDLIDGQTSPALSATSDMPVVETKPDAQNEGAPPETQAATPEEGEKQPGESATPATEEQSGEPAKKESRGVQKALDRLTAEREAEKREKEAVRKQLDDALEIIKRLQPVKQESVDEPVSVDPEPVKPRRQDYRDPDAFEQAILDYADQRAHWSAKIESDRVRAEERKRIEQESAQRQQEELRTAHAARIEKFKQTKEDFDTVATREDVQVSIPVAMAIFESENGPALQYYLGANPEEAKRIYGLSYPRQLLELGRIEAELTRPAPANAVVPKPAPIKPLTPSSEKHEKDPNHMSMDEYRAYRGMKDPRGARH